MKAIALMAAIAAALLLSSQTAPAPGAPAPATPGAASSGAAAPGAPAALPKSYRGIELGMPVDRVKELLVADELFGYRGDPDVSILASASQSLIECVGPSFIKRAFFQFYEGKLFSMIFMLNEAKADHYSVFTSLQAKYGKPSSVDPATINWNDGTVSLSLERPLTVKYLDVAAFDAIKGKAKAKTSEEELSLRGFLGEF